MGNDNLVVLIIPTSTCVSTKVPRHSARGIVPFVHGIFVGRESNFAGRSIRHQSARSTSPQCVAHIPYFRE